MFLTEPWISADAVRQLYSCFHSVEELDLYLLLKQDQPQRRTAAQLGRELALSEAITVQALQHLVACGLIDQPGANSPLEYCYATHVRHPSHVLDELERLYRENRFDLVALMARQAIERIRQQARVAFSPKRPKG
jgi:predicted transcriptional regulator